MKKLLILLMVFAMVLSGCLGLDGNNGEVLKNAEGSGIDQQDEIVNEPYIHFAWEGDIYLDMTKEKVVQYFGEPGKIRNGGTELRGGLQIQYIDDGISYIYAESRPPGKQEIKTDQGVKIGDSVETVFEVYGEATIMEYMNGSMSTPDDPYTLGYKLDRVGNIEADSWLVLDIVDDVVSGISLFYGEINELGYLHILGPE